MDFERRYYRKRPRLFHASDKLIRKIQLIMEFKREKQKVINKNHWMVRLYRFCWNEDVKYQGFCPLFWVSWFNLAILPLVIAGKGIESLFGWVVDLWPESAPKPEKQTSDIIRPSDLDILMEFEQGQGHYFSGFYTFQWNEWKEANPNWKTQIYPAAKARHEEKQRLAAIRDERNKARKLKLDARKEKIIVWTKYLVKPALLASAILAAWAVYKVIGYCIGAFSFAVAWAVCKHLMIVGVIVAFIWLIAIGVGMFMDRLFSFKYEATYKAINKENREPGFFSKCGGAIGEAIDFIKDTVQIVYYKNCPVIRWSEEETRPIEKIQQEDNK